jgi:hypothetical protein
MGEVVWTIMASVSAAALLYGAWLVLAELVRDRDERSPKTVGQPLSRPTSATVSSRSNMAAVHLERRSGVERRSSQRQAAERIAA